MAESNSYKTTLIRLDTYYNLAREHADKPSFYKYLYNYIEIVAKDETLNMIANLMWITKYMSDHSSDKKLDEILSKSASDASSNMLWHTFAEMMNDENKDTRFYYSWLILATVFYAQYNLKPEEIRLPEAELTKLAGYAGKPVDINELRKVNQQLKTAFKSLDFEDMSVNHETFIDALNIFHTEFRVLLNEEDLVHIKAASATQLGEKQVFESPAPVVNKIVLHKFQPQHYVDRTGELWLSVDDKVEIATRGKVRRPKNKQKYEQCWLMECLFKNVNSLKSGISFSKFLGVKYDKNNKKHTSKIRNTVYEINKKVSAIGGPNNLIKIQKETIFLNNSYQ